MKTYYRNFDEKLIQVDGIPDRAYAAMGYQDDKPGDLFIMVAGCILTPIFNDKGVVVNVGADKKGRIYNKKTGVWEGK